MLTLVRSSVSLPSVGSEIYVCDFRSSELWGTRAIRGGKVTVEKVEFNTVTKTHLVFLKELPGRSFDWRIIDDFQSFWKERYGDKRASFVPADVQKEEKKKHNSLVCPLCKCWIFGDRFDHLKACTNRLVAHEEDFYDRDPYNKGRVLPEVLTDDGELIG